ERGRGRQPDAGPQRTADDRLAQRPLDCGSERLPRAPLDMQPSGLPRFHCRGSLPRASLREHLLPTIDLEEGISMNATDTAGEQATTSAGDAGPLQLSVVRVERGGPWDWSRELRQQEAWDEHAHFMNALVDDGFIL